MADTQQAQANELIEAFDFLESWEDRYGFLADLGRKLPPMDEADKTEANRIQGCQSMVWLVAHARSEGGETVLDFVADSDSALVKGLVAILYRVYSGQPADKIRAFDIEGLLERLDLSQHLTMQRRNGLQGMIQRIRTLAATLTPEAALIG